jgi:hypothetical protein
MDTMLMARPVWISLDRSVPGGAVTSDNGRRLENWVGHVECLRAVPIAGSSRIGKPSAIPRGGLIGLTLHERGFMGLHPE